MLNAYENLSIGNNCLDLWKFYFGLTGKNKVEQWLLSMEFTIVYSALKLPLVQ